MNSLLSKNKYAFGIGAIVLVCVLLAGVRFVGNRQSSRAHQKKRAAQKQAQSIPAVRAFICEKKDFVDRLVITGTLQGGARVELRFNRDGRISQIKARVGDKVKKGQLIAALDTGEAKIKRQQAEAELSQAVELFRTGAIAKPRLTQARLAAELVRKEFKRSFIRAPRSGSIGELNAEEGEYVNTQMTIATLVSVDNVFVEMGVIEKDLSKLHLNQTVKVVVETYPNTVFEGKIARIAPMVEGTSRTRTVRAKIPNKDELLLPGMFAQCEIFIMEKHNILVVPTTAVKEESQKEGEPKSKVFIITDTGKVKAQPIQVGYRSADYIEVLSGLKEGSKIVANLPEKIRDGLSVEVIEEITYNRE